MFYELNSTNHLSHTRLIFLILIKRAFIFAFLSAFHCVDGWKVLQFYKRDNGRFVPVGSMCPDGGQMQKDYHSLHCSRSDQMGT
jgi:hypothetical protein